MALQAAALTLKATSTASSPSLLSPRSDTIALKSSFLSLSHRLSLRPPATITAPSTAPKFFMRTATKQAYICRDCGYIYNDKTPFDKLPDTYFCPVCGSPKRRFKSYDPAVGKNANDSAVRKARKAQIKNDEAIGRALPIGVAIGALGLAALYFYINKAF